MPKIPFITAYSPKLRVSLCTGEDTPVQQHYKDECDINLILKQYRLTGDLSLIEDSRPVHYVDSAQIPDFFDAQIHLAEYSNYFSTLPSAVRLAFGNDYKNMLTASPELLSEHNILGIKVPPPSSSEEPIAFAASSPEKASQLNTPSEKSDNSIK